MPFDGASFIRRPPPPRPAPHWPGWPPRPPAKSPWISRAFILAALFIVPLCIGGARYTVGGGIPLGCIAGVGWAILAMLQAVLTLILIGRIDGLPD